MSNDKRARLKQVLQAYGADPAKWPAEERAELERQFAQSDQLQFPEMHEAREIDAVLSSLPEIPVSNASVERILDAARQHPKATIHSFPPTEISNTSRVERLRLREALPFGLAMAASLLIGVFAGLDDQIGGFATVASLENSSPSLEENIWSFDPFNMNEGEPL